MATMAVASLSNADLDAAIKAAQNSQLSSISNDQLNALISAHQPTSPSSLLSNIGSLINPISTPINPIFAKNVSGGAANVIGPVVQSIANDPGSLPGGGLIPRGGAAALGGTPQGMPQPLAPTTIPSPASVGQPGSGFGGFLGGALLSAIPGVDEAALTDLTANFPHVVAPLTRTAVRAAANAPIGGLLSPNSQGAGATVSGVLGAVTPPALSFLSNPAGILGKGLVNMFPGLGSGETGAITPAEFAANRAAQPPGVKLPLGNIANSPAAKSVNTMLGGIPLSGAEAPQQQAAQVFQSHINQLTDSLPADGIDPDQLAYNATAQAYEGQKAKTSAAYQLLANATGGKNLNVPPTNTLGNLSDQISNFSQKADTPTYQNALNALQNFQQKLSNLTKTDPITNISSAPSYQDMLNLREEANSNIRNNLGFGQGMPVMRQAMHDFVSNIDNDLQASTDSSGDQQIQQLAQNARNERTIQANAFERNADNSATPFHKLYNTFSNQSPDTKGFIKSYIQPTVPLSDSTVMTQKLLGPLDQNTRNQIGAAYVDSGKTLGGQIKKATDLSPTQQQLMFGDNAPIAQSVKQLVDLFPEAKSPSYTPKTGYTGEKISQAADIAKGIAAMVAAGGVYAGHPGGAAALLAAPLLARGAAMGLRSNAIKNLYAQGLLNQPVGNVGTPILKNIAMGTGLGLLGTNNNQ